MTEGLFLLTTIFVAYVIYVIVNEKKAGDGAVKKSAPVAAQPTAQATVAEKPKAPAAKAKPAAPKAPAAKPATAKPAAAKKATLKAAAVTAPAPAPVAEPATIKGSGLKDPKTGEISKTYTNYRFTKRWIKDALVAEKLVDKIYKNDEMNDAVEAKIKAGIAKLEGMKKYQP